MKVAIFGATGGIGSQAVRHALNKGYEVNAYVRSPKKLTIEDERLHVFVGELTDRNAVRQVLTDVDAVIWCVGIPMKKYEGTPSLDGHKVVFQLMKELGIKRFIDWSTTTMPFEKDKKTFWTVVPPIMIGITLKQAKVEILAIADLLRKSDLEWTVVRFLRPTNGEFTGRVKAGFGEIKMSIAISRADIAWFMVEQVESREYIDAMPFIGS